MEQNVQQPDYKVVYTLQTTDLEYWIGHLQTSDGRYQANTHISFGGTHGTRKQTTYREKCKKKTEKIEIKRISNRNEKEKNTKRKKNQKNKIKRKQKEKEKNNQGKPTHHH